MKSTSNITGIVLCGGRSKRMGENKALLKLGDKTLIEHAADKLSTICTEILISTNGNELDFLPYQKVKDKIQEAGPILGIFSALEASKTNENIIISCDTPFVPQKLLKHLFKHSENYNVVLPIFKNHLQPTIGYFHKNVLSDIKKAMKIGNMKPINIFENANINAIHIDEQLDFYTEYLFFNINSPEDYEEAKRIYKLIADS